VAVGLDLVPRTAQSGVRVTGVLQLEQPDRQPVEEDDDVRPAVLAAPTTLYWCTTSQSLLVGSSPSTSHTSAVRISPAAVRCSTGTPPVSSWWTRSFSARAFCGFARSSRVTACSTTFDGRWG
jgi:hypothetical protein